MSGPPDERQRLRHAVAVNPADFIAWVMLSDAELDRGDAHAGLQASMRALQLRPSHPEALARQGRAHWMRGEHALAVSALRSAVAGAPDHPGMALWLAHALEDAGEAEDAALGYQRAYHLMPDEPVCASHLLNWRRRICDWRDLDRLSAEVRRAVASGRPGMEPFGFLSEDAGPDEQLACARLSARRITAAPAAQAEADAQAPVLRMGFLSNGFGSHPTGLLTVALFEAIGRLPEVEAHLFALNRPDHGETGRRLRQAARVHEVAGLAHGAVARRIKERAVQLLFDLRGWGGGGRPEVLAMRPAPVQVNWLAYPGTSGAPWMDFVLADGFVLPDALAAHFSERVMRLPRCFQPSDTARRVEGGVSRGECGLPPDGFVFCCFNNSYKLNPRSFGRMLAALRAVERSVLWLLSGPGRADRRLRMEAERHGVDPQRLVFMAKQPHAAYLQRYRHADLFLDTNPYNAHTTASDALWAGCPVLTLPGATFASRVAGSMNHHLGLHEMNVDSDESFIARATALATDPAELSRVRLRLRQARSEPGLFDMAGFAQDFVDASRAMLELASSKSARS
ncbi:MAG TPA: tetratricopeptide repeat protein [Pseudoxanthomonas sp.]|nr:tetratricopeptide repeat protein [Pseudoxanthomonas sp.]